MKMACYHPQCYLLPSGGGRAKHLLSPEPVGPCPLGRIVYLPCGGCLGCRLDRRHELAVLQSCEAAVSEHSNWFLTLTYDDWKCIELTGIAPYSLEKSHIRTFNELMRKFMSYHGLQWRFYGCGEYGGQFGRPHFHLSVFNVPDEIMLGVDKDLEALELRRKGLNYGRLCKLPAPLRDADGREYWHSPIVADRWPYGSHKIYRATKETFEYVAGYVVKKLTGRDGKAWRLQEHKCSEFQFQSRPSIGRPWFDRYFQSIAQPDRCKLVNDCVAVANVEWRCPRIFSRWIDAMDCFDGPKVREYLSELRQIGREPVPDYADLKRKEDFAKYRASQFNKERKIQDE